MTVSPFNYNALGELGGEAEIQAPLKTKIVSKIPFSSEKRKQQKSEFNTNTDRERKEEGRKK